VLPLSLSVVALAVLATGAPAHAAPKAISGKLSKPGYTLIALADSGKARVVRVRRSRFAVRPPARRVTLQLRRPDGVYAGPVVVGRRERGTRAIVGVRAGTKLGRVRVRHGYATVRKRLGDDRILSDALVRARRGKPIGAGRFGRVRSRDVRDPLPADRDLDGIPDVLDVDDDGDLVPDAVDPLRGGRAAQDEEQFGFFSRLTLGIDQTANANATGLSGAQMDAALSAHSDLLLSVLPSEPDPNYPELDCGGSIQDPPRPVGLIYCRSHAPPSNGIGTIGRYQQSERPFPDCCDPDGDGLGTLTADTGPSGERLVAMSLHHGATAADIKTGDVMIQSVLRDGGEIAFLAALQYVFASVPAVQSYRGETGPTRTVEYPYTATKDPDGNGPMPNLPAPFQVADGQDADDDVEVTLTFWRPQRSTVAAWGETAEWIDVGRLAYEVQVEYSGRRCPQNAFSEEDERLALNSEESQGLGWLGFTDLADDQPANTGNTFTYTLNLSRCLEPNGFSFEPGETRGFSFLAVNPYAGGNGQQGIWFERQP
jgi:hypothetical protein